MMTPTFLLVALGWLAAPADLGIDTEPILRLEAGGPTSYVTALAFGPEGGTLFAAGWDKVVRVWTPDPQGRYRLDPHATYRVPIGPGLDGALNAMAVSADGRWVAAAGKGVIRHGAGFRKPGLILPSVGAVTDEMRGDEGTILLFETATRRVRSLRGAKGPVLSMTFVSSAGGRAPLLLAAVQEWNAERHAFEGGLYLWDVDRPDTYLAGYSLPRPLTRPGLAGWLTPNGTRQLAIAWGNQSLYFWEPDTQHFETYEDGAYNSTLVYDGRGTLWTGSANKLRAWRVGAGQLTDGGRTLALPGTPRALAPVPATGDRRGLRAAAVLRRVENGREIDRLHLLDLGTGALNAGAVELWEGGGTIPSVAVAPDGRTLAVGGNKEHTIEVHQLADVAASRRQPQVLASVGASFGTATLVHAENSIGILLRQAPKRAGGAIEAPRAGDLIFDLANRVLRSEPERWSVRPPPPNGWEARVAPPAQEGGSPAIVILRQGKEVSQIPIPERHALSDFALLPSQSTLGRTLLALASHELGQPSLVLYDANSGEAIRHFTGHVERIRSVAFSQDGRFLVTAADDQTVNVWSLVDLPSVLGKRGLIPGLAVIADRATGRLSVAQLDARERQVSDRLAVGDVVLGVATDRGVTRFASPRDFYNHISLLTPGNTIRLRVRGSQGERDISLTVRQGIDERKPLFSLFVTRPDPQGKREWIGWNPIGPYESSSLEAERLLGWHFNTGKTDAPTAFAFADQYRKTYFREGILRELLTRGTLPPPQRQAQVPPPKINLSVQEHDGPWRTVSDAEAILVHSAKARLGVSILDFPTDRIAEVKVRMADGQAKPCIRGFEQEWFAEVTEHARDRSEKRLVLTVTTNEDEPRQFERTMRLRYQPPRPLVKVEPAQRQVRVSEAKYTFRAWVAPAEESTVVQVSFRQWSDGKVVAEKGWRIEKPTTVEVPLQLPRGDSTLELKAWNDGALPGAEAAETNELAVVATYYREPVPPPEIDLKGSVATAAPVPVPIAAPWIVHEPQVELLGRITAREPLQTAQWRLGGDFQPLPGFVSGTHSDFTWRQTVPLAPGKQTLELTGKTATSTVARRQVTLEYRPRLPRVTLLEPADGTILVAGATPAVIRVRATFEGRRPDQPFDVVLLRNGLPHAIDWMASPDGSTVSGSLPLIGGENRIRLRLENRWHMEASTEEVTVLYRRPPHIVSFTCPASTDKPLVDVAAILRTPAEAPVTMIRLNERSLDPALLEPAGREGADRLWKLTAKDVALQQGDNVLSLLVANADGPAPRAATARVRVELPPPPRAQIEILEPARDATVVRSEALLAFRVTSASPLVRVEVYRNGERLWVEDGASARASAAGAYALTVERLVPCKPGANQFRIVVVNAGGEATRTLTLNYVVQPIRLVIDRVESIRQPGRHLTPKVSAANRVEFDAPSPDGNVWLVGRVVWLDAADRRWREPATLKVRVNGFLQNPAELGDAIPGTTERPFRARLFLNRAQGNRIEIELPRTAQDASTRSELALDCLTPVTHQRLHLLIIGIGEHDRRQMIDNALKAYQATLLPGSEREFQTPAFEHGILYGPLVGYVTREHVFNQLVQIRLGMRNTANLPNHLVMVYYQGRIAIGDDGQEYLRVSVDMDKPIRRHNAISKHDLLQFFEETQGATVLCQDVFEEGGPARAAASRAEVSPHVASLRVLWQGDGAVDIPFENRLIAALRDTMPKVTSLKETATELTERFADLARRFPLRYEPQIPPAFEQIIVGRP